MTIEQILKKVAYRNSFFAIVTLLIIVLVLIRYIAIPHFNQNVEMDFMQAIIGLLENLVISLIVTVCIAIFIYIIFPDLDEIVKVSVIGAHEISDILKKSMNETDIWWYMGASGRYLRAVTIDKLIKTRGGDGGGCHIMVLILDPTNDKLCEAYTQYRRSLSYTKIYSVTTDEVKAEILATILKSIIAKIEYPQLKVDIGLRNAFSTFRYDLSSSHVIITKEDPQSPAMRCDSPGYYYKSYKGEIQFAWKQARVLNENKVLFLKAPISITSCREIFQVVGLDLSSIPDDILLKAIEMTNSPENPYE